MTTHWQPVSLHNNDKMLIGHLSGAVRYPIIPVIIQASRPVICGWSTITLSCVTRERVCQSCVCTCAVVCIHLLKLRDKRSRQPGPDPGPWLILRVLSIIWGFGKPGFDPKSALLLRSWPSLNIGVPTSIPGNRYLSPIWGSLRTPKCAKVPF